MNEIKDFVQSRLIELYKFRKEVNHSRTVMLRYVDGKIEALTDVLEYIKEQEKDNGKV